MRVDVLHTRDRLWVETPFEEPEPKIVVAASRAGGFGVLDLGADEDAARRALTAVTQRSSVPFGVRVSARCPLGLADLPDTVDTIVVAEPGLLAQWQQEPEQASRSAKTTTTGKARTGKAKAKAAARRIVAEVRSADEARAALDAGVDGLVAKGAESGGRVGTTGAFVLSQQLRALTDLPVWVQGGIGPHTAAAAVVGGAAGVVLDAQVALLDEVTLPRPVRQAITAMDGSETRVVGDHRIFHRPDLWVAKLGPQTTPDEIAGRLGARSLADQALPAGQDAAFAARFAERYGTVGRMVSSLRREIAEHVEAARTAEPLAPGHGVSPMLGTPYPVVQGPMTRVSDRAAFAHAVAEAGGMPFLALALLRAPEVRPLLEESKGLLGDRPWGVGVLGFVPKELREEQLAVIRDVKPPLALIAGGRPSQATTLEEVGIRTFLHVPAPGLLERFLKDGARRFVFEGFECGGHVGPRSSFALWETQVDVLLDWARASGNQADELDLLFAGGIHDERSAAMVAALTAPLAAAGARVGVLMGTAYLFTEEAVAAGAIGEEFQEQAIACERTALLESGPGHQTRCAETPFVDLFESTRRQLHEQGVDHQVIWGELEGLNLGRLRVASKGLKREGEEIVNVDRDEQRRDGMFMIGDVATLHAERTTMAQLHESVTAGATAHLESVADDVLAGLRDEREQPKPRPVDVAVVGMACIMPGAEDLDAFWRNVVEGVDAITEVPPERWDVDRYFDPEWDHQTAHLRKGSASKWGGFIPDVTFDALRFGIPPASLAAVEPVQLLSLKVAADALVDAGYRDERDFPRDRTSVIFGAEGGTDQSVAHGFRALYPTLAGELPPELDEWLPKTTEDSFPGLLTNVIAGRITNRLNLGGKNLTVDAACASSLAALDAACIELAAGSSDVVLCGGADLHNGVQDFLLFTSSHALSTKGRCRTFDQDADGIALGEGIACVVLKRLEDAERDGDRIYAVVRATAGSSDGRSLGLTAPRQEGQELALRRAYEQAGISPSEVGLIEAHGTGTVVGDRTELKTLTQVFREAEVEPASSVMGSVKSMIGHTKCAAGLAGFIKAAKAIYHGVLPPTLFVEHPNEAWDSETSPFVFLDATRPWLDERRVAGVSAFGFGGTNFHVVVESHDSDVPERAVDAWPAELFVFRGEQPDVDRALASLAERLESETAAAADCWRLRDAAAAVSCSNQRGPVRAAIVADDLDDLRAKVDHARQGRRAPGVYLAGATSPSPEDLALSGSDAAPGVAFLFPGQGSQRPGMASDLFVTFAETRSLLRLGEQWAPLMLPPAAFGDEARDAQRKALTDTRVAQPALGLADLAAARVLQRAGVRPDMAAGHSYGELVALCVAGAFDERALLALSQARGEAILASAGDDPGAMAAVSATAERLDDVLDGLDVIVANHNHPTQLALAGSTAAVDEAMGRLKDAGITAKRLPVACAFHSPIVAGASETLSAHLAAVAVTEPSITVFSNLTADTYPADAQKLRELLAAQVANPVRFTDEIRAMYDAGARIFVEVGPGRTLTGCVEKILGDLPHLAVATDRPGDNGVRAMLHALAQLAVAGVAVDVPELFEGRGVDASRWTNPGRRAGWTVNGHMVRTAAGDVVPGGLRPANTVPRLQTAVIPATGAGAAPHAAPAALPAAAAAAVPAGASNGHGNGTSAGVPGAPQPATLAGSGHPGMPAGASAGQPGAPAMPSLPGAPAPVGGAANGAHAANGNSTNGAAGADQVLIEYFRAAQQIIGAGHQLVMNYLGATPGAVPAPPTALAPLPAPPAAPGNGAYAAPAQPQAHIQPQPTQPAQVTGGVGSTEPSPGTVVAQPVPAPGAPLPQARPALPSPEELLAKLVAIVSARTGYPEDMLDPDLDVEADLSIDSIKRLEILGELADQIGLGGAEGSLDQLEDLVEELAARKSLRGIVNFLDEHADRLAPGAAETVAAAAPVSPLAEPVAPGAPLPQVRPALPSREELLVQLTAIVSARTGYPEDMLDPDLDVEADLSIDSIKRLEILGELADQIGFGGADGSLNQLEDLVEELAARKTLRGIVDFLLEHAPGRDDAVPQLPEPVPAAAAAPAPAAVAHAAPEPQAVGTEHSEPSMAPGAVGGAAGAPGDVPPAANRFVVALGEAPLGVSRDATALSVRVEGVGPLASALADELAGRGAQVSRSSDPPATAGTVVLTELAEAAPADADEIPALYRQVRPLLLDTTCDVLVATALGGGLGIDPPAPRRARPGSSNGHVDVVPFGAGARGLVKTAALEFPERQVRLVDLDPATDLGELARTLADEVLQEHTPVEVGWRDGQRRTPVVGWRDAASAGTNGNGHQASGSNGHGIDGLSLTSDSVVLLTGGARGITARVAIALAQRYGCNVELLGRSAFPEDDEDPAFASCPDKLALRAALVRAGQREPRVIERECNRILAEREIRQHLAELQAAGAEVVYHQVDVRDGAALSAVVASIYERHGRLDGIVHGAGMLDDHFIADKTPEAFDQVFATKVDAARTLLDAVHHATAGGSRPVPQFVAFFGSIAGVCGNRGQIDYAAANDALDTMAAANPEIARRVFAVDWGPWSPEVGMVSDSLAQLFAESGMGLIEEADGTTVMLDEVADGDSHAPHQIVAARCSHDLMVFSLTHGRGHPVGAVPGAAEGSGHAL